MGLHLVVQVMYKYVPLVRFDAVCLQKNTITK